VKIAVPRSQTDDNVFERFLDALKLRLGGDSDNDA